MRIFKRLFGRKTKTHPTGGVSSDRGPDAAQQLRQFVDAKDLDGLLAMLASIDPSASTRENGLSELDLVHSLFPAIGELGDARAASRLVCHVDPRVSWSVDRACAAL